MSQNENSLKNKHASDGHTHHHEHKKNETTEPRIYKYLAFVSFEESKRSIVLDVTAMSIELEMML